MRGNAGGNINGSEIRAAMRASHGSVLQCCEPSRGLVSRADCKKYSDQKKLRMPKMMVRPGSGARSFRKDVAMRASWLLRLFPSTNNSQSIGPAFMS